MLAAPVPPPDSTTSGYSVPWTRNSAAVPAARRHADLPGGALEGPDELAADDLALLLRVGHPGQRGQERLGGVDDLQLDAGGRHEVLLDLVRLPRRSSP